MNITDGNTKLSELDVEIAMPPTINKNELISVLEKKRSDVLES